MTSSAPTIEADVMFEDYPHLESRDIIEDSGIEGIEFIRLILGTPMSVPVPDSIREIWESLVTARNLACEQIRTTQPGMGNLMFLRPVTIPVETARAWIFAHIDPDTAGISSTEDDPDFDYIRY